MYPAGPVTPVTRPVNTGFFERQPVYKPVTNLCQPVYKRRSGGIFDFRVRRLGLTRLSCEKVLRGKEKGRQKKFPTAMVFDPSFDNPGRRPGLIWATPMASTASRR